MREVAFAESMWPAIMSLLGIMQGRLLPPQGGRFQSFPRDHWGEEFAFAGAAGLESIEWIYDAYGQDVNPIATDHGISEIRKLGAKHGVAVRSICADYFMDYPIVRANPDELRELVSRLQWLVERAHRLEVQRMVLPFVDASRIRDESDQQRVIDVLEEVLPSIERSGVEIHLETTFSPSDFAEFLGRLNSPAIKVNYDSGNSASLGYEPASEFAAYGPRIGSVHIKDRLLGGGTVPLGTGAANLRAVFEGLLALDYAGDVILQVARGKEGDEVSWARQNRDYVTRGLEQARSIDFKTNVRNALENEPK